MKRSKWHSQLAIIFLALWGTSLFVTTVFVLLNERIWLFLALINLFALVNFAANAIISHLYIIHESQPSQREGE